MKSQTDPELILKIENLSITFDKGQHMALDHVDFEIFAGQTLGLVGESGSGKSLSSLAILGLLPKSAQVVSGSIHFGQSSDAIDLLKMSPEKIRLQRGKHISMIFQEPMTSLNPSLTCGYQVEEMIRQHSNGTINAKERVLELFTEVKLPRPESLYEAYPHEISGGQKQRVMIAMAIACKPKLLIADEPTTALDVTVQKEIVHLLKDIQSQYGMSILFITHDLGLIKEIADEVVVMYKGKIVEKGSAHNLLSKPSHPYTQGLLASKPPLNTRPVFLPTVQSFLNHEKLDAILVSEQERNVHHQKMYAQVPILKIESLNTLYATKKNWLGKVTEKLHAVNQVSFDLYRGETLGLVGESGCGKTSLGRSILRLAQAQSGSVWYNGEDILKYDSKQMKAFRKKIQIIFQDPYSSLNPKQTVGALLTEVMQVHKIGSNQAERMQKAAHLLVEVGLEERHLNHYPHQFSGGQRQRIGIARALALEPEIIVCDESVSALDVSVQAQVLNLLNRLKKQFELTYIFISHDLSVVRYMSDRIIVMNRGKIEEMGEADALFVHPQKQYTKELIASIPGV